MQFLCIYAGYAENIQKNLKITGKKGLTSKKTSCIMNA